MAKKTAIIVSKRENRHRRYASESSRSGIEYSHAPLVVQLKEMPDNAYISDDSWAQYFARIIPGIFAKPERATAWRLFSSLKILDLSDLLSRAEERDRLFNSQHHRDLASFFLIVPVNGEDHVTIRKELEASGYFAYVSFESTIAFPGKEFEFGCTGKRGEGQLEMGPDGISARYAWTFPGGDGAGLRFIDIEGGWILNHEDLRELSATLASGENSPDTIFRSHGTSVLSIVASLDDGVGISGVVPGLAAIRTVSIFRGTPGRRSADAVLAGIRELRFGDVLLLEVQTSDGGPAIFDRSVAAAVRLATALGVVVITAAGNGNKDLDEVDEFKETREDTGALLVGASMRDLPYSRWRTGYGYNSSFGEGIHCFAWGAHVRAAALDGIIQRYGLKHWLFQMWSVSESDSQVQFDEAWLEDFDKIKAIFTRFKDKYHTNYICFSGTSAASAIIAGAALCVQGLAHANLGFRFSPWQLRLILSDPSNGTPSANPAVDKIGVMPDLKKVIDHVLCLPADVYLRDTGSDVGDPVRSRTGQSPDIIVWPEEVPDPQLAFGEGSGHEDDDFSRSFVRPGPKTAIYLRVCNRGGEDASDVRSHLYVSEPAILPVPSLWKDRKVGATDFPTVRQGDVLTVSRPISWSGEVVPEEKDLAWIALVGNRRDPAPEIARLESWEGLPGSPGLREALRSNNNLVCRNLHARHHLPMDKGKIERTDRDAWLVLRFLAPGPPDVDLSMRLEVLARLPRQAKAWIEMPPEIADLRGIWGVPPSALEPKENVLKRKENVLVPVNPNGQTPLRERRFAAGSLHELFLHVWVPADLRDLPYRIAVRHLYKDEQLRQDVEVGRVTWRLLPRTPAPS